MVTGLQEWRVSRGTSARAWGRMRPQRDRGGSTTPADRIPEGENRALDILLGNRLLYNLRREGSCLFIPEPPPAIRLHR